MCRLRSAPLFPIFDRQLSLSGNATARDAGMLAYISVNGAAHAQRRLRFAAAVANPDTYNSVIPGKTLTVSDPAKGVIANDVNVYGVKVVGTPSPGHSDSQSRTARSPTLARCRHVPSPTAATAQRRMSAACATVTLGAAPIEAAGGITVNADAYTSQRGHYPEHQVSRRSGE